jgi:hypothetical protein
MANPDPKKLAYFDNANHVPAPYGVNVPFNQEQKDIWLGYDEMTGQLCITNFNRTVIIVCFSAGGGGFDIWSAPVGVSSDFGPVVLPLYGAFFLSGAAPIEADRTYEYKGGQPVLLSRLSIRVFGNSLPAGGNLFFTIRKGATLGTMADTPVVVTIPIATPVNTTITNTADSVLIQDGDFVSIKITSDVVVDGGTIDLSVRIKATP